MNGIGMVNMTSERHNIIEPSADEKTAAVSAQTFWRTLSHDSTALGILVFAAVAFIICGITVFSMFRSIVNGSLDDSGKFWMLVIAAPAAALAIILTIIAFLVARHHHDNPVPQDLFSDDGYLFSTMFMPDKKQRDDKGTVRIDAVRIDECVGYHNKKDKTIWIVPNNGSCIYDIWRKGKTWNEERNLCLSLIENGIPKSADTDPFFGVSEQYLPFMQRIGVHVEETTQPVDFIAGTWRPNDEFWNMRD